MQIYEIRALNKQVDRMPTKPVAANENFPQCAVVTWVLHPPAGSEVGRKGDVSYEYDYGENMAVK